MRAKLTEEDVAWLERRLSHAMVPVVPRAAFVHDAKQALLSATPDGEGPRRRTRWLPFMALALTVLGLALLVVAIARRRIRVNA